MKRFATLVLAVLWLPLLAHAEPLDLTNEQAEAVLGGLAALSNGNEEIAKKGTPQEAVAHEHYKGWSIKLIDAQKKGIAALTPLVRAYEEAKQMRTLELEDDNGKMSPSAQLRLMKEDQSDRATVLHVDLDKFKESELNAADQNIPPGVLAALTPILAPEAAPKP